MSARTVSGWIDQICQYLTDYEPVLEALVNGIRDVLAAVEGEQE